MKKVCVYSGSNLGNREEYKDCARKLGKILSKNGMELVYGGSNVGLMGELAKEVLENGGKATGVIPTGLFPSQIINQDLTLLIEVNDMHERKKTMADLADAFIALPGGVGTFEELFEVLSWSQLGIHKKPVGILNVCRFFDPLLNMIDVAIAEGFMNPSNKELLLVDTQPQGLIEKMKIYSSPVLGVKWKQLSERKN
ncbi:MAG: Rossman fold protein family [Lacrimispora sp.]|nr:Rossman fold protein family [Lacrimispora sp.]